ncbi:type IX secretion system periplasmic lipoprotein PorW/SprE [Echinicola rosea]|uniref:type IX secretion system periplasmic lipoprotein PorW/SprE n=1 Tax=Echinicola rosea TaxID=1807691 RepID=UPI0010CA8FE2|nr:tetratricopeptide repeat protein [Echinicola rosea]
MRKTLNFLIFLCFLLLGCSSERNTFTNRLYHNVTARFNAYFLAKEKIQEAEKSFREAYQEDYTQVLPVYFPIDSASVDANEEKLNEARELAGKAIDWHRISQWVDDSYFLLGLIDYYEANTDDAINTYKYLNVNSEDDEVRHQALIQLLRIFVEQRKFDDASYVIDFLSKESEISKENKQKLYKTLAYYYEARHEKDGVIAALEKCIEVTTDNHEKSRLNFILAQLYQRAGFDARAYDYYKNASEGNPPYELAFFSQLYAQQVAELEKSKDLKKVRDYYDNLYQDRKNTDLRDVVLYEKALFELKQKETDEAIKLLHQAAQEPGKLEKQKGYIYQKLAEIFFDEKEDYRASKYYLDSALQHFKPTDTNYQTLSSKQDILDRYTVNYELLTKNDSLLQLSQMRPEEQEKIAENYIQAEEERLLAEAEAKTTKKNAGIFDNLLAFGGNASASTFYFDNPTAMQKGEIEFFRNWGNRALEDNWRRKSSSFGNAVSSLPTSRDTTAARQVSQEDSIRGILPDKATLLANIPKDPEQISQLNDQMEEARLQLGKVLYFDLKRPDLAREYLTDLLQFHPDSEKKAEAYYTLFLIEKETGGSTTYYVSRLNKEFPDSPFTKSVNNPIGETSSTAANKTAESNYQKAYSAFQSGDYSIAKTLTQSTLNKYPLTEVTDKLLLLDIMLSGKLESKGRYQERLENYIENTDSPGLVKMARNMLVALTGETEVEQVASVDSTNVSDSLRINTPDKRIASDSVAAEKQIYKLNKEQTHIFILVIDPDAIPQTKNLSAELENFHDKNFQDSRLRTGNLSFTRNQSILLVSPFSNAAKAMDYRKKFLTEFKYQGLPEELKKRSFVISIQNFQQLNKRKDITEYEAFFKSSY